MAIENEPVEWTGNDGRQEFLVTEWSSGKLTIATRTASDLSWSAPTELVTAQS